MIKKLNIAIVATIIFSYFLGFYFREISNGAGHGDLELHIWLILQDFEKNYFHSLKNYLVYNEATFPFFHSIQHFLNPFKNTVIGYTLSNTIFNLAILILFYHYLKKKNIFSQNKNLLILVPFIFLLSPWFRSTSYWGMTENLAILFFIPTCFYFNKLIEEKNDLKIHVLLTIFISLTIYSRQQYIYLVFAHLLILLIDKNIKNIFMTSFIYFLLAIPGIYVYYLWGVHENVGNVTHSFDQLYSINNIVKNIPKISSILFFYTIPLIIINYKKIFHILKDKIFILFFVTIYIFEYFLFHDLKYTNNLGGGFIIKFYKIFLNENNYFLIFISSLFFSILFYIRKEINNKYLLILLFVFIVIGFIETLYQEWFDPIYLVIYLILLPNNLISKLKLNNQNSIYFLFFWELMILFTALIYYHWYLKIPLFYSF
tara:strand:- start:2491 stop:3777 length:1287 start_codon:yes stop_codon:yes gene_type:complete